MVELLVTVASAFAVAYAGHDRLSAPPILHPTTVMRWWASVSPIVGAMSFLWAGALLAAGYWVLLCGAAIVSRLSGRVVWLARLRLPGTNRLLRVAAGASLLGATVAASGCGVAGGSASAGRGHEPPPPVLLPFAGAPTTTEPAAVPGVPRGTAPIQEPVAVSTQQADARTSGEQEPLDLWTVKPGDDLWSISGTVLAGRLGRRPDDREIASLWLRVIEVNRATLADPANPNLIFAGEVVDVPR